RQGPDPKSTAMACDRCMGRKLTCDHPDKTRIELLRAFRSEHHHGSAIENFVEHRFGRAGPEQGGQGPERRIVTYPNGGMSRCFTQYSRISSVKRARRP